MRKEALVLGLTVTLAILTARAISQEIVIEPTNGRPQTTKHVTRPAPVETAPVQANKPAAEPRAATKTPPKKGSAKHVAAIPKTTPVESKPALSAKVEEAKSETPEVTAVPKKLPAKPGWAMADSRDPRALQTEIASALARDPKLVGSSIQVNVDDGSVTLEGRAAGTEERLQAERLALSYAWNRKLVDHIEIVRGVSAQK